MWGTEAGEKLKEAHPNAIEKGAALPQVEKCGFVHLLCRISQKLFATTPSSFMPNVLHPDNIKSRISKNGRLSLRRLEVQFVQ